VTKERRILASASLFHALNDAATVAVPMIFPILYAQQVIIRSYSQIGLLSNFGLLTTFLFQILVVHAARRFEYKLILCVSFAGISLSLILIPFSTSLAVLFFLYLLFRVFDSFYHTLGLAWVSRAHPSQGIDFAMGVQSGSGNLGVFVAFISAGFLAQTFGWNVSLFSWAAVCLCLGTMSFLLVRKVSFGKDDLGRLDFSSWVQTIKLVRRYVVGFMFGGASWGVTVYFAPSLLHNKFEIPMGETGVYLALWIGVGTVMTYLFGRLSRKFGRVRIYRGALLGAPLSLILIGLSNRPGLAVAGLVAFGMFLFLIYPALQSFVGNAVPPENQPQAFGLVSNVQMVSGALLSLAAGFLSDRYGISSPFLVLGFLGLAAMVWTVLGFDREARRSISRPR
jgi:YNFM family putative membrane transporter